jgi:site-specific DNA recombinase
MPRPSIFSWEQTVKAIILARVSSKEQEDNNSIPAQVRRLQEYTERYGLEVLDNYQLVESSTTANRRKFSEIITRIKKSKETIALVTDTIDRLQRGFKESVMLNDLLNQNKLELHFMREGLVIKESSNSSEILRWDMGVMFAKSYVTQLSDNVKRSMDQKRRSGEWCGRAPFGYLNIDLADGKKWIEPDPANRSIVLQIFEWYAGGSISMNGVAQRLKSEHGVTKSVSTIDKILKNPFYHGTMLAKGKLYEHKYTPLISEELFDAVQARAHRLKIKPRKYAGLPYMYRGVIRCADCGCSITPEKSKGLIYYHCTQYKGKHGASYVREEALTEQLEQAFARIQPTQEQFDEVMTVLKQSRADKTKYKSSHVATLQAELKKVETRIDRNHDAYLDGDVEKDYYQKSAKKYKAQKKDINRKLNKVDKSNEEFYVTMEKIIKVARNAPSLLESSKVEQKRELFELVLQNLELKNDQLRWKYKKPFDLMAFYDDHSSWLGRRDSNPRMPAPKAGALPLGDAPTAALLYLYWAKNSIYRSDSEN